MHSPFALSLLIPAADLGTEQVTAILLHGQSPRRAEPR